MRDIAGGGECPGAIEAERVAERPRAPTRTEFATTPRPHEHRRQRETTQDDPGATSKLARRFAPSGPMPQASRKALGRLHGAEVADRRRSVRSIPVAPTPGRAGSDVSGDGPILGEQVGRVHAIPGLPRRDPRDRLHDEFDRVVEPETPSVGQAALSGGGSAVAPSAAPAGWLGCWWDVLVVVEDVVRVHPCLEGRQPLETRFPVGLADRVGSPFG